MEISDRFLFALTLFLILGSGIIGGVFFAFSTFVMKALARLPSNEGIAAMQSINIVVLNPWFLGVFFATAIACGVAPLFALPQWREPGAGYLILGAALYLVGTFLVTIVFNVPRNKALALIAPNAVESANEWAGYLSSWTFWNHVRTIAALAATASFSIALVR